jgi:putative ABC transport system permease protein
VPGLAPGTPPDELDISVPAVAVAAGAPLPILSPRLLSSPALRAAKPGSEVKAVVARPAVAVTVARMDQLRAALVGISNDPYVESSPRPQKTSSLPLIMAIAAGVVALGAAAIATGLAAADSRADLMTLAAVGAGPGVRRSLSLAQSGIISGLGAVLGAAAGFGAAAAVLTGINRQYAGQWPAPDPLPIVVPWTNLLVSLVVVPVVAMLGAGLLTRSRLPSERRVV